jgi:hypothetical protein
MATVSGNVMLRPVRMGLLTARPSLEDVQVAVKAATSSWGGMYFPIIDVSEPVDHDRRLERWSVDALWPVTTDGKAVALANRPGFRWRGRSPYGPFDPPRESLVMRVLPAEWILGQPGIRTVLPRWPDHELAAFFSVWFGTFGTDGDGSSRRDLFAAHAQQVDIDPDGSLDRLAGGLTPITVTSADIAYQGEPQESGIVLVDPLEPADLLRYWNLRASGAEVLPWPLGREQLIEPFARRWINDLVAANKLSKIVRGDGAPLPPHLTVWSTPAQVGQTEPLDTLIQELGLKVWPGDDFIRGWRGAHPLTTDFTRWFDIEVDPRARSVPIPLPVLPWPSGRRSGRWPGMVAADVHIHAEHALAQERTTALPRVRRLAKLMPYRAGELESFQRPNGQGGIYGVQAPDDTVDIPLVRPLAMLEGLFDQSEWRFAQSDDGQFAARLAEMLKNSATGAANQSAVREVLLLAAKRSDSGVPFPALLQRAIGARGRWPGMLSTATPGDYGRSLLLWLLERRLLRMVLPVTCPSCRSALVLAVDELGTEVRCGFCDHSFPLALPVAAAGPKSAWRYRIAGHVPESRLRAALPVLAASSVLATLAGGGFYVQPRIMGAEITAPGRKAEFDIAAIVDPFTPQVVLGEVKSHQPIDTSDIDNLAWAQDHLRTAGVECYILIATLNEALNTDEIASLRAYCEQARELLNPNGSQTPLAMPIVLTQQELSVDQFDDAHPSRWTKPGQVLSTVAIASCKRNLGLREVRWVPSNGRLTYEFSWQ